MSGTLSETEMIKPNHDMTRSANQRTDQVHAAEYGSGYGIFLEEKYAGLICSEQASGEDVGVPLVLSKVSQKHTGELTVAAARNSHETQ